MEYNPFTECGLSHSLYGINLLLLIKEILLAAAKDLVHTASEHYYYCVQP